jgi:integrase
MACVRMRRGKWTLDFRDQTGSRRWIQTRWSSDKDKPKAEKLLVQYEAQIDDGKFTAKKDQRNFEQLTEAYLANLDVRKFTRVDYESVINTHLKVYFGRIKLRAITPLVVEQFRAWMQGRFAPGGKRKLAVRTVNKSLTTLSQILGHAERHRWLDYNPCKHVKKLKQPIDQRRRALDGNILMWDECERLFAAAAPRDRVLFRMAVETGMRQGELLGLHWSDVDLVIGRVFVRHSCRKRETSQVKTAASMRTIGLAPVLVKELRVWKLACPKPARNTDEQVLDLVFPNAAGGYEDAHNLLRRGLHRALDRAFGNDADGKPKRRIKFHELRHTCASLLLASGVGIKHVQAQLGHSSATITLDVYGHLMPNSGSPGAEVFHALGGSKVVAGTESGDNGVGSTHGSHPTEKAVQPGSNVVAIKSMPA